MQRTRPHVQRALPPHGRGHRPGNLDDANGVPAHNPSPRVSGKRTDPRSGSGEGPKRRRRLDEPADQRAELDGNFSSPPAVVSKGSVSLSESPDDRTPLQPFPGSQKSRATKISSESGTLGTRDADTRAMNSKLFRNLSCHQIREVRCRVDAGVMS